MKAEARDYVVPFRRGADRGRGGKRGDARVADARRLTEAEERELASLARAGDRTARERLVLANMRLAVKIAGERRRDGIELDDLIQAGNLGLMRAAEDFDPDAHDDARFSTYAACWIRYYISRAVNEDAPVVKTPYYLAGLRRRFERVKAESGGVATDLEAAERMGESGRLRLILRAPSGGAFACSSLGPDDDESLGGALAVDEAPEAPVEVAEEMIRLHEALDDLPSTEAQLIRLRFRIGERPTSWRDERPRSYRELGALFGISPWLARKVEGDVMSRLRETLGGDADEAPVIRPIRPKGAAAGRRSA